MQRTPRSTVRPRSVWPAPTSEQVAEARADAAPAAPRRTMPLPRRAEPAARPAVARRRIRGVGPALVVLAIAAVLGAGAWIATRAVYFVGTDSRAS